MQVNILPWKRLAGWALVLNSLWEFGQCTFLFDMWTMGFVRGGLLMWASILGDVLIVCGVVYTTTFFVGPTRVRRAHGIDWAALIMVGFFAAVLLEFVARILGLWDYSETMPTLELLGTTVGLSPIFQITFLPAASLRLATLNDSTT